jgi:nitrate reductase gamma subunit
MDQWLNFAMGPLFAFTFLFMAVGLVRQLVLQIYQITVRKGRRLGDVHWGRVLRETASWLIPFRHISPGSRLFSTASFLMHIGLLAVPLLLIDHVTLWEAFLGFDLPAIGQGLADYLTLFTIGCLLLLLGCRTFVTRQRVVSRPMDYAVLVLILLPFVSGYMASHPAANPFPWQAMMLTHVLTGEALLVAVPFSKLSHIVLFFFDRVSAVHWQLRPGAGDRVAEAMTGKEVRAS